MGNTRQVALITVVGFCLLVSIGCKKNNDPRNIHVHGTISLNGKPIQYGKVAFYPDASEGTAGPAGLANIVDGKYDTDSVGGKGVMVGTYRVEIENFIKMLGDGEDIVEARNALKKNPIQGGHVEQWVVPDAGDRVQKDFVIKVK